MSRGGAGIQVASAAVLVMFSGAQGRARVLTEADSEDDVILPRQKKRSQWTLDVACKYREE